MSGQKVAASQASRQSWLRERCLCLRPRSSPWRPSRWASTPSASAGMTGTNWASTPGNFCASIVPAKGARRSGRKKRRQSSLSFLDQLNPQQREAVESTEGPLLILAGAGSGKTRVITYRIAHLIENLGIQADSILAVTFTNKAAAEMGERVEKLLGGRMLTKPVISTFHSFCVRLLRRDIEALRIPSTKGGQPPIGHTRNFVIYDEADQQSIVKSVMKRMGITTRNSPR